MNNSQEFQFINGAPKRLLLIIEPTSSEFWIESRATVKILLEGANVPATFDVEYPPAVWCSTLLRGVGCGFSRMVASFPKASALDAWHRD